MSQVSKRIAISGRREWNPLVIACDSTWSTKFLKRIDLCMCDIPWRKKKASKLLWHISYTPCHSLFPFSIKISSFRKSSVNSLIASSNLFAKAHLWRDLLEPIFLLQVLKTKHPFFSDLWTPPFPGPNPKQTNGAEVRISATQLVASELQR